MVQNPQLKQAYPWRLSDSAVGFSLLEMLVTLLMTSQMLNLALRPAAASQSAEGEPRAAIA